MVSIKFVNVAVLGLEWESALEGDAFLLAVVFSWFLTSSETLTSSISKLVMLFSLFLRLLWF